MIEPEFYYLDEAAKKLGFEIEQHEPSWKNPVIRLGASRKLPIYILTNGLTLWEQVTHATPITTEEGSYDEELVTDEILFHPPFKRVQLSAHCLMDYAAGKEETEAFTDEGRIRKAASLMMAGDFVKTWIKIKDPRTGNAPMLKDCVIVVLPDDLKRLQKSPYLLTNPDGEETDGNIDDQKIEAKFLNFFDIANGITRT